MCKNVGMAVLVDFMALEWTWQDFCGKLIEIYKTNKNVNNTNTLFVGVAVFCGR